MKTTAIAMIQCTSACWIRLEDVVDYGGSAGHGRRGYGAQWSRRSRWRAPVPVGLIWERERKKWETALEWGNGHGGFWASPGVLGGEGEA